MKKTERLKILVLLALLILVILMVLNNHLTERENSLKPTQFGVSFSPTYASNLGLDPKEVYQAILTDLNIKNLRLNAYWSEIETAPNQFDFSSVEYYLNQARQHQAKVILAVGYKLPRWPECFAPYWINYQDINVLRKKQLIMLEKVIAHFENNETIVAWQVENEPLLQFGICPPPDADFLKKEIALVRSLTKKPIIITDSGELSTWILPMQLSDIFGTTLYRLVSVPLLGSMEYPLQPWSYSLRSSLVRKILASHNQKTIITELQAEPWTNKFLTEVPLEQQVQAFTPQQLQNHINYARRVGFEEIYLWGVEWWYYMKVHGYPQYWLEVKKSISH